MFHPLQISTEMKAKEVLEKIFTSLFLIIWKLILLFVWIILKLLALLFDRMQKGLETYVKK